MGRNSEAYFAIPPKLATPQGMRETIAATQRIGAVERNRRAPLEFRRAAAYVTGICTEGPMPGPRHVRLFRNGRNQAVRIPVEFELPGDEAIMHRDGDRLVIEPVRKRGLVALLKTMKPLEEGFPAIDDPVPAPENVL